MQTTGPAWFILVHSPIIAKLFKRNLVLSTLVEVVRSTAEYRSRHSIYRSSRQAIQSGGEKDGQGITARSITEFIEELERFDDQFGFVSDLFPAKPNTGKGNGRAPVAGNTFYLRLADKSTMLRSKTSISRLIELTWPLFLCLYPVKPIESRTAGLARKMPAYGHPQSLRIRLGSSPGQSGHQPTLSRRSPRGTHQARRSRRLGPTGERDVALRISPSSDRRQAQG